jgi:hypothetical protein
LDAAGFIIIKELENPSKRTLIRGMGIVIDGNMILTAFSNLFNKNANRRYGEEEIFFKPFSHFK